MSNIGFFIFDDDQAQIYSADKQCFCFIFPVYKLTYHNK